MSWAIIMIDINITNFVVISCLEKNRSVIETHRLKIVVIFILKILSFVLSRKIITNCLSMKGISFTTKSSDWEIFWKCGKSSTLHVTFSSDFAS